ncbi:hypothetical protein AMTR_s00008p00018660 [Amborella trichopoda]|uniref:Uncharacterized protein n=1 Tax=Amborella trichopoda TaxID=13333 RepID=W1NII0_AMBTC|nr:hypothetical protein AMTR_s00008p00018660 [Amborella trichopoda]
MSNSSIPRRGETSSNGGYQAGSRSRTLTCLSIIESSMIVSNQPTEDQEGRPPCSDSFSHMSSNKGPLETSSISKKMACGLNSKVEIKNVSNLVRNPAV